MSGEIVVKDFEDNKKAEVIRKTSNITSIDVGGEQVLIEDNFLPEDEFKEIQEYYLGSSSPCIGQIIRLRNHMMMKVQSFIL